MFDLDTLFDTVDSFDAHEAEGENLDAQEAANLLGLPVSALQTVEG